jgi:16S rRNA (cytosine967-C5)-methyltransferase
VTAHEYVTELLGNTLAGSHTDAREAALATELVYGVVRMRGTLDWVISLLSDRPVPDITPRALMCIRIGLYQLMYLDRIPRYAAVNESVKLAGMSSKRGQSAFVNAVLRGYLKNRSEITFPDRTADAVRYMSVLHSHPGFLVKRWIDHLGVETTEEVCRVDNLPAPLFVRTNALKTTRNELVERLAEEGVTAEPVAEHALALRLLNCPSPSSLRSFREGLFYIQDLSAMKVVSHLKPQPNEKVLDMCAAPGGKVTFIAEQMQKHGEIVACDADPGRTVRIHENLQRLGIPNVTVISCDMTEVPNRFPEEHFDRVLVDAPCTNTGVLRRRVEARWRLTEDDFMRLPELQIGLLRTAARMTRSGGVLVYSTCSIERDENESVVETFLSEQDGFRLSFEESYLPVEGGGDGGYVAKLARLPG